MARRIATFAQVLDTSLGARPSPKGRTLAARRFVSRECSEGRGASYSKVGVPGAALGVDGDTGGS